MTAMIVTLADNVSGTEAKILVSQGFNCFQFRVPTSDGMVDVLWSAPGVENGTERPSGSGIPLLFPFPGRIPGGRFSWEGREFHLPQNDRKGNAIHGFAYDRPWRVIEQTNRRVVGEFQASVDDPGILDLWPADFRMQATYELVGPKLVAKYRFENPDSRPLPCGFGTHPYFRVPLVGTRRDDCVVKLPIKSRWELIDLLPTGRKLSVEQAAMFQQGQPFGAMQFDDVFADLIFQDGWCEATIDEPSSGKRVSIRFDSTFRECVVYTPPHREAICIEPYSCVPGAGDLQGRGVDAGLRILQPGEAFECCVEISVQ